MKRSNTRDIVFKDRCAENSSANYYSQKSEKRSHKAKKTAQDEFLEQVWKPQDGFQQKVYESEADELLVGGAAGPGKSAALLIVATRLHRNAIIFRREYSRLKDIIEKSRRMLNPTSGRYNSTDKIWRLPGSKTLEFGAVQYEDDKENYRGREHDLKGFDELTEFSQTQYEFIITWNRSSDPNQKCRVISTCNPPSSTEGAWIIDYWSPWLKEDYPGDRALPGELRWFATLDGESVEVPNGDPIEHTNQDGITETIIPRSRSFIPGSLDENIYLRDTNYRGMLQRLPEPLRSQLLYGSFKTVATKDHPWQIVPTEWYDAAVARWTAIAPAPQSHLGVDVARGGDCYSVIAPRHHHWLAQLIEIPGKDTPDGDTLALEILKVMRSQKTEIRIDVVGVGSSPYDSLRRMNVEPIPINGGATVKDEDGNPRKDRSGVLQFYNLRSYLYWNMREILDPKNKMNIALPPDPRLKTELLAPRWSVTKGRTEFGEIRVESKDDIVKRIGRSPDKADATVYAFGEIENELSYEWMREI
jgi:hypothetical protein